MRRSARNLRLMVTFRRSGKFPRRCASLVNPQQVLPGSEIALESQTLRYLEAGNDLALYRLVSLVRSLAREPIVTSSLIEMRGELVGAALDSRSVRNLLSISCVVLS
jgi:hypothetical protein